MSSLTQAFEAYEKPGIVVSYKLAATKVFKGSLVGVNVAGYLVNMDHSVASLKFVGVANETVDNSAGNPGDKLLNVTKSGSFVFKANTGFLPAMTDMGKEVYAFSDWEVQASPGGLTNPYKLGTIVGIDSTSTGAAGVRIRIDVHTM